MKIRISLPEDRDYAGWLEVVEANGRVVLGPFPAAGRAHDETAAKHGNAPRNPLLPYGDTPTGVYAVRGVVATGPGAALKADVYGANSVVRLEPISGPAALADAHGRFRLFIQGGGGDERLAATAGAVRLFDGDQKRLVALIALLAERISCEIVTTVSRGAAVDLTRSPAGDDPPQAPDRQYVGTPPTVRVSSLGSQPTARSATRFLMAVERSGASGGSTAYGDGGEGGPPSPGGVDGAPGGSNDTTVGPLPITGVDVAPTPGADLNPPADQTADTPAQPGESPLLSSSSPNGLSNPNALEDGWLAGPQGPSPYYPAVTNTGDTLSSYVGANGDIFTGASTSTGNANSFLGSPAADPFLGSSRGLDTSGYLAMNGDGIVAPPPAPDAGQTTTTASVPPSSQWVDATTLAGLTSVGTTTDPNGNSAALYQVNVGGVTYNAYLNDMKYPGQALLVPISLADPGADPGNLEDTPVFSGAQAPASTARGASASSRGSAPGPTSNRGGAAIPPPPMGMPLTPLAPPSVTPVPMPLGTAAEGPVGRIYYPGSVTLPRGFPAYDLVQGDNYDVNFTFERPRSGPFGGQDITVINQTFEGGHWISVKTTTSDNALNELNGALEDMFYKSGAQRHSLPVDPDLPTTVLRVQTANPDSATIHLLIPEAEAGNVPALQAAAEAHLGAFDLGQPPGYAPGLPGEVNVRVTAWPGLEQAGPAGPPRPVFGPGGNIAFGAGAGGAVAVLTSAGWMMFDDANHPDWDRQLAASGAKGTLGGAAQQGLDQSIRYGASRFVPELSQGSVNRLASGGGAFFAAAGLEAYDISQEPGDHSAAEVSTRVGRMGAIGLASAEVGAAASAGLMALMFGAAAEGAVAGSVVPGWGTAIGFVVGLAVGAATFYALDKTVPGGREDWRPSGNTPTDDPAGFLNPGGL
jgi:hypothetical protein